MRLCIILPTPYFRVRKQLDRTKRTHTFIVWVKTTYMCKGVGPLVSGGGALVVKSWGQTNRSCNSDERVETQCSRLQIVGGDYCKSVHDKAINKLMVRMARLHSSKSPRYNRGLNVDHILVQRHAHILRRVPKQGEHTFAILSLTGGATVLENHSIAVESLVIFHSLHVS